MKRKTEDQVEGCMENRCVKKVWCSEFLFIHPRTLIINTEFKAESFPTSWTSRSIKKYCVDQLPTTSNDCLCNMTYLSFVRTESHGHRDG